MSLQVTTTSGVVTIACGSESVVVVGQVVRRQFATPTVSTGPARRVDLLPALPPGVSVMAVLPALGATKLNQTIKPALDNLIDAAVFKELARHVREPFVVTVEPSEWRAFKAAKRPTSVVADVGKMPLVHRYLTLK
jgi:hypothetical protein